MGSFDFLFRIFLKVYYFRTKFFFLFLEIFGETMMRKLYWFEEFGILGIIGV